MEFNPTAYRILKHLKQFPNNFVVGTGEILRSIRCLDRGDFDDAIFFLKKENLVTVGKTDCSINAEGKDYLRKIENQREESAYEYVDKDYDYCVFKFLFENKWGVRIEEFPMIIKKKAPDGQMMNNGNLIQYLYNQADFIDERNSSYYLNDDGITSYILQTERKKQEKEKELIAQSISVGQIGDVFQSKSLYNSVSKGNSIHNSSERIPLWKKLLGDVRSVLVGYIIIALVSFVVGKSCNSTSNKSQDNNSVHKSIK